MLLTDQPPRIAVEAGDLLRPHQAGMARYAGCLLASLLMQKESAAIEAWAPLQRMLYWFAKHPSATFRFYCARAPRRRPDIFHATSAVLPTWKSRIEIATIHDLYSVRAELRLSAEEKRRRMDYIHRADAVICVSDYTRSHLHALSDVPTNRTTVIRPAPHSTFARASPEEQLRLRRKYQLATEFFLFLGRDRANKNLDRLVEGYAMTGLRMPLYLAGVHSRSTQHRLRQIAERHCAVGSLRWLGRIPDTTLPVLLSCATTLCMPSTFEGFGLPIVEAMACGTTVLTSAGRATEEASGGMAELVNPESSESIAEGLRRSLDRTQAQLMAAQRYATSRAWADVAAETWDVYRRHM